MQLSPRYDGPAILELDPPVDDPLIPLLRQRARLAEVLATLDEEQWSAPSRCDGWSTRDVVLHLNTTNGFWAASVALARAGQPTRFLTGFDPVATPAQLVAGEQDKTSAEVLAAFVTSNQGFADALDGIDAAGWDLPGEAPPGHVALRSVALHALWDGWVHERDILLPLGLPVVEEPDEVAGCLRYGTALGPAFLAAEGSDRVGTYVVEVTDPELRFVCELGPSVRVHTGAAPDGAFRLTGRAVDVLEALSFRTPLGCEVPEDDAWMLGGLAVVFDRIEPRR